MRKDIEERVKIALASGINLPLLEYLQAKQQEKLKELMLAGDSNFRLVQGKAQELEELITLVKSVRE